jgi:hypothetical protein
MTKRQPKKTLAQITQEALDREAQILALVTAAGWKGLPLTALVTATGWPAPTVRTVVWRVRDKGAILPTTKGLHSRWVLVEHLPRYMAWLRGEEAERRRQHQVLRLRAKAARKRERERERERAQRLAFGGRWTPDEMREAEAWANKPVCLGTFPAHNRPLPVTNAPRSVFELGAAL